MSLSPQSAFHSFAQPEILALLNLLALTTSGYAGHTVEALPVPRVLEICRKYGAARETR